MVCLNAPIGVIPDLAIMATTSPPLQVASRSDDGDTVTWYITPKRPEDTADPEDFIGPGNVEAEIDGVAVQHAVEDFRELFPALAEAAAANADTKWGVYNGMVQRIEGHAGGPFAELAPSTSNVVVGMPGLIHMIYGTAEAMVDQIRPTIGAVRPTISHNLGESPAATATGAGVAVGVPNEAREGFVSIHAT